MLAYLDESGDPGFKVNAGSSRYFVVALVVFEDEVVAERVDQRVAELRRELRFHPQYEFKFNKLNRELRVQFLRAVSSFPLRYYGVVLNKEAVYGPGFQHKESFYKYVSRVVCTNAQSYLREATVVIDGSGSREFRRSMDAYLRRQTNTDRQAIRRVQMRDSRGSNLLQVADMIAGALARSFSDKFDADDYRSLIRPREAHVQFWPKGKR